MFDIGFWEIILISVIGLIVLGPERLPIAIRSVMRWINTAKAMANSVKTEISQELKLHEMHEMHEMHEKISQTSKQGVADLDPELQQSIDEMQRTARESTPAYENKQAPDLSEQDNSLPDTAKTARNKQDKTDECQ